MAKVKGRPCACAPTSAGTSAVPGAAESVTLSSWATQVGGRGARRMVKVTGVCTHTVPSV